ncbi:LysR family transcriptional regulator [Psychromonas aquimarina]|uniref:LysR family transcriptional regulator n=1 Tax=Psychromonas aquimarina TaxID=444919 RepID=UPI0003FCECFA|nr:LysR family transcriptional regulator [Psychromonas aquimarina]
MYSLEQLKIFVAVSENGSFSATARKLKRAQSGISQSISNLEISLDKQLFDRGSNTPTLSDDGKALLPVAKSLLQQQRQFDQKVAALSQQQEHELIIGIEESLSYGPIFSKIKKFAEQFPMTNLEVVTASTYDIEEYVRNGDVHIGLIYSKGEIPDDVDFGTLGYNKFITVAGASHPLAGLQEINDQILRAYRQLVLRTYHGKELWFSHAISTQIWYASNHHLLLELAEQGIGWTMLPEDLALDSLAQGKVILLDVTYEPYGWMNTIDYIVSRRSQQGPALQGLIKLLKQAF